MLPKLAFFASTVDELRYELRPAIESVLAELGIPTSKILVNVGDDKVTSNDDLREFKNLDTPSSEKQFILLVNKGKEGWNCRSLFGVALHREPKSKVFVLQATMRCLRQIGDYQHTGLVFLSDENTRILNDELQNNFNVTLEELGRAGEVTNIAEVRIVPPPISIKINRVKKLFQIKEKTINHSVDFKLSEVDIDKYKIIETKPSIDNPSEKIGLERDLSQERNQTSFTEYTIVAEIAKYLNLSPMIIKGVLNDSKEGIAKITEAVNQFNEILYDEIIPTLFHEFYEIDEYEKKYEVELKLVKEPKDGFYSVKYKDGLLASIEDEKYALCKDKSFNLDKYCFDSIPERDMFWKLINDNIDVEKVWFTGMLTHGQTEFFINYIDPVSGGVRSYYPDFLVKKKDGSYVIIEVKGDNMIDDEIVISKMNYAKQIAAASNMKYLMIKGSEVNNAIQL